MHTQRKAAAFVVETKDSHYIFGVKANQAKLWNAAIDGSDTLDMACPAHESTQRGHGRIDRHRVWTTAVPASITFPYARQFVFVERESSNLKGKRISIELRFYVTDLTQDQASAKHLLRLINGHWSIENSLHWVRDVTFDEDRSQVRTGTTPRVLATLRNLAISIIRHATSRRVNIIAAATRHLARQPDTILDLLGIPTRLCT